MLKAFAISFLSPTLRDRLNSSHFLSQPGPLHLLQGWDLYHLYDPKPCPLPVLAYPWSQPGQCTSSSAPHCPTEGGSQGSFLHLPPCPLGLGLSVRGGVSTHPLNFMSSGPNPQNPVESGYCRWRLVKVKSS